ncbi:MAG: EamA family transporter [Rhodobacterales bacterium 34-62-10]|nr:MAG: EamA family transporter [Rhodobacterales bacterium 34-62-10]
MAYHPTPANWASIGLLGLVWGSTFMVVSVALRDYGPLTVACARTTLGAVALILLMRVMGRRFPLGDRGLWPYLAAIGVLSTALPFFLLSWGQQYVPSAFAGISMAALPLFVLPLAHLFAEEPLTLRRTAGVVVGFIGAAVLIGPGVFNADGDMAAWGQLACVGAALSYAVAAILTRRCPPIDPVALSTLTLVVGSVVLIPLMLAIEGVPGWAGQTTGLAILFLGLMPTALAALLRVQVIRTAGPVFMTLVNYQVPLWSMVFGALVLSEALPWRFFVALGLILTGLALSQWGALMRLFGRG